MKKTKIPDDYFKTSELAQIMLPIAEKSKALSGLKAAFEKCALVSVETGKPVIDPFLLAQTLKSTQLGAAAVIHPSEPIFEGLRQWASAECSKAVPQFESRLRAFCEKQSFKFDGGFPSYLLEGFLPIRVRESDRETEIGNRSIPSLSFDSIAPVLKEIVIEERARKFDRAQFLDSIFAAYERCLLLNKAAPGDPIPIRKLYSELVFIRQADAFHKSAKKSLFTEYTLDFFARDLTKALAGGPCQARNGGWLAITPTSFSQEGIPIWQGGQARIVGRIAFSNESM